MSISGHFLLSNRTTEIKIYGVYNVLKSINKHHPFSNSLPFRIVQYLTELNKINISLSERKWGLYNLYPKYSFRISEGGNNVHYVLLHIYFKGYNFPLLISLNRVLFPKVSGKSNCNTRNKLRGIVKYVMQL